MTSQPGEPTSRRPAQPDLSGRRLGDYQLIRRLGRGGMAEVYLAEQESLGRRVALKILRPDLAEDPTYLERFRREARSAAALVHAGIVQIYEVAEYDGLYLIAQEYVQGLNLREWLRRHGTPGLPQALSIMRQVASALAKAADAGIIHRDVKPENIMLSADGDVKVADFGLARLATGDGLELTQTGMTMGTPLYMSPEQIEGRPLDPRSDLYSFGVTCYHMLAGEPPFTGETALSVALKHVRGEPERLERRRPDLPPELCRVVHKMLAKDPADRHESARAVLVELRAIHAAHVHPDWPESSVDWEINGTPTAAVHGAEPGGTVAAPAAGGDSPTVRLSRLMRTQPDVRVKRSAGLRPGWRYLAALVLVFLLGGLIAWRVTRPEPLLPPTDGAALARDVPRQQSVRRQWLYAVDRDTEAAWRAVIAYFPEQEYYVQRAKQQLAQIYLLDDQYGRAMTIFDELAEGPEVDAAGRAYGLAGRGVVHALEGRHDESARALDEFYPVRGELRDGRMRQLVRRTIEINRRALGAGSRQKWEAFLQESFGE